MPGNDAILADARWFGAHGIGRFARNVITRLPHCDFLTSGPKPLSLIDSLWLAFQIAANRPAVFFTPAFNPPAMGKTPLVITIHDLAHLQFPAFATWQRRLYYNLLVRPASHRAYRVITVSEYSRLEILKWSGLADTSVINVGNGVDPIFCAKGRRYDPGFPYILYVGAIRPHKNIGRLLTAFGQIDDSNLRLILTGKPTAELNAELHGKAYAHRVRFTGRWNDEALAELYRGALCLVLPSLIEGFGLPALEAMACGTPVIVSKTTALSEVVGNAGILIDPLDVSSMTVAVERMLAHQSLRQKLQDAGLRRAAAFTWVDVADRVNRVIQEAMWAS